MELVRWIKSKTYINLNSLVIIEVLKVVTYGIRW